MKYVKQSLIILAVSFLGEMLSYWIPLRIPGSIYGIVLMFTGLVTGVIPYEKVRDVAHWLVEIMPILFVPAGVGILDAWDLVRSSWLAYLVLLFVSTVIVMAVAGRVTQAVQRRKTK